MVTGSCLPELNREQRAKSLTLITELVPDAADCQSVVQAGHARNLNRILRARRCSQRRRVRVVDEESRRRRRAAICLPDFLATVGAGWAASIAGSSFVSVRLLNHSTKPAADPRDTTNSIALVARRPCDATAVTRATRVDQRTSRSRARSVLPRPNSALRRVTASRRGSTPPSTNGACNLESTCRARPISRSIRRSAQTGSRPELL
jgi:hypothetical protein